MSERTKFILIIALMVAGAVACWAGSGALLALSGWN